MSQNRKDLPTTETPAPTVTVTGQASVRAEPDEALLWITLSAVKKAPGPALSDVSTRSNALVAMLDELGVAKADRSTTGVTVYEEFDHTKQGRRSIGHRASSRVGVRLTRHELIGRLISQSTRELAARVDGPQWQIAHDHPVRLEAARIAAADAVRKARAYAEGVGAELGPPIRLAEPGTRSSWEDADRPRLLASRAAPEPMAIEPGEHEVGASIQATFALELN
ncbi:MAG: SIMPL domain-containing protein [Solirubrobacteraceae bacterium]